MKLQQQLKVEATDALKKREKLRLSVLRGVLSACTNELVSQKRKPSEELSDEDVLSVIKRLVKQRKESIEQFEKGGRKELADRERSELAILQAYLPETMKREEIEKIAYAKKNELGINNKGDMGKLMKELMKELSGKADGKDVKSVVEALF